MQIVISVSENTRLIAAITALRSAGLNLHYKNGIVYAEESSLGQFVPSSLVTDVRTFLTHQDLDAAVSAARGVASTTPA